jgi:hypothetical protein
MANERIIVRTRKELDELTSKYRGSGYNIVTFGEDLRELEKDDSFIIIIRRY